MSHRSSADREGRVYDLDQWQELFWHRGDRYYWCALRQNLFGEWVLLRRWGGRRTGKGGQRATLCADLEEGRRLIQTVRKRRRYRKYALICVTQRPSEVPGKVWR